MVAVEALLSGAPVVATASGGLRDVVRDGDTGLLVPPGDSVALAVAMDALLARADRGGAMGSRGRQQALARFAPAAIARRYADLYRSVRGADTA
jgi:glycosyltransferase involved in cell wall biosynthesis